MIRLVTAAGLACMLLMTTAAAAVAPGESTSPATASELAQRIDEIKLESVNLARDIWLLDQNLGDPAHRLVVFISMDAKLEDRLEKIELKLGADSVALHEYSAAEADALRKGGAHRLYSASLEPGRHVLDAQVSARGESGHVDPSAKLSFRSEDAPKLIELHLQQAESGLVELVIHEWD